MRLDIYLYGLAIDELRPMTFVAKFSIPGGPVCECRR
jgi:hypothetical protein